MTFICDECGERFEEEEIATWTEERGEFWGRIVYEKMSGCPYCHSGAFHDESEDKDEDEDEDDVPDIDVGHK